MNAPHVRMAPYLVIFALVLSFVVPPACRADTTATSNDPGPAIDAFLQPLVDRGHVSGQLLVTRNGETVVERSFGFANARLKSPMTPETRINIASITKPMTVYLAYEFMKEKKIGYRDPISRWLPDFPMADSITVEHLLRHRSGIRHELVPDSLATEPRTAADMVRIAAGLPLDFPPGSRSSYSSAGFTVLAHILEIAGQMTYGDLVQERLFGPLGMTHSEDSATPRSPAMRAVAHLPTETAIEEAPFQEFSGIVGAGSVWSTARDVDLFVQAVVSGRLTETMQQSYVREGRLAFNGRTSGFTCFAAWDSSSGVGVIYLGNVGTGAADLMKSAIPRIMNGEPVPPASLPELRPASVPLEVLKRYEGTFQLENGVRLNLNVREGILHANNWPLVPTADGDFFSPRDYGRIKVIEGTDGRIERLDWKQGDQVYPAPRVES